MAYLSTAGTGNPRWSGYGESVATVGASKRIVSARILWPALGFPAVIAPRSTAPAKPLLSDASHTVCALVVADAPDLTPADAARYLRHTPWPERRRRIIEAGGPGSFQPAAISVRRVGGSGPNDDANLSDGFQFGEGASHSGISVSLAKFVRSFYRSQGLTHLYEIRVAEPALSGLADGLYQLFWNANNPGEERSSDELNLLLNRFAVPLIGKMDARWAAWKKFFLDEYKLEYGPLHPPYDKFHQGPARFTEVLHPVFIRRKSGPEVRIAHVTDTHVSVRNDVYERNLDTSRQTAAVAKGKVPEFNNWNRCFETIYADARKQADVVLLTGDLIDYGRGPVGLRQFDQRLGDDDIYHRGRNWFLFYYLLASGDNYTQPAYTILGNHDWRLNPYPPFAPGTPSPNSLFHNHAEFSQNDTLRSLTKIAHGSGHERKFSYSLYAESAAQALFEAPLTALGAKFFNRLQFAGSPVETHIDSVAWYLLLINPFLDFRFSLPSGHEFLMLDWARDEELANTDIPRAEWRAQGERAANSLTSLQRWHMEALVRSPGKAKVVGIHAPPIAPSGAWSDEELAAAKKTYKRGAVERFRWPNGDIRELPEHPIVAVRRRVDPFGIDAAYGSITKHRDWFIWQTITGQVSAILGGHIHRRGLFWPHPAPSFPGGLLLKDVSAVAASLQHSPRPLYMNTTSAGPRAWEYSEKRSAGRKGGEAPTREPGYGLLTLATDGTVRLPITRIPPGIRFSRTSTRQAALDPMARRRAG